MRRTAESLVIANIFGLLLVILLLGMIVQDLRVYIENPIVHHDSAYIEMLKANPSATLADYFKSNTSTAIIEVVKLLWVSLVILFCGIGILLHKRWGWFVTILCLTFFICWNIISFIKMNLGDIRIEFYGKTADTLIFVAVNILLLLIFFYFSREGIYRFYRIGKNQKRILFTLCSSIGILLAVVLTFLY